MAQIKARRVNDATDEKALEKLITDLSNYTGRNDVLGGMVLLANALKSPKLIKICKALQEIYSAEGSAPSNLMEYRRQVMSTLFELAEQKWGKDVGKRVYKSF